jgi:hypothetical protein
MSESTAVDDIQPTALPTVFEFLFFKHEGYANPVK